MGRAVSYYEEMAGYRDRINARLLPCGANVTYVGVCVKSLTAIWYFGKETGFAGGGTPEAVVESIHAQIFGGL